jgi:cytochrome c553
MKQKHKTHTVRLLVVGLFFASIFFTMAADVALAQSSAASDTSSFSGLVPCGRNGDPSVDPAAAPCTTCHAVLGAKKAFDYLVSIMVVVGIAVIMGMGVLYILSGVNESLLKTAKGGKAGQALPSVPALLVSPNPMRGQAVGSPNVLSRSPSAQPFGNVAID